MRTSVGRQRFDNGRVLLTLILVAGILFLGSILFILSRAPHS